MIRIRDFTYTYPASAQPALVDVNLDIPEGQFVGIVGANGAGKSTLCFALSGFIPDFYQGEVKGSLEVAGRDLCRTPVAELAGKVGLVFANPFNQITGARFTVREELAFGLENLGCPREEMLSRVDAVLKLTGLAQLADRSPYALSGGQQQRVAIASVIVMRPRVLVLDEPTSQLDPVGAREVFETLDALTGEGTTVILAEHKLEWIAAHADRVVALAAGRIVADGAPDAVLGHVAAEAFGLAPTRYTLAARLAVAAGLAPRRDALPVTLDQAIEFFAPAGQPRASAP